MSKWAESQCDKLVQEIACTTKSQWSNYPAECGHHIIHRGNLLWRWRLMNIAPLTIEEHTMHHAGLLDPLIVMSNSKDAAANFSVLVKSISLIAFSAIPFLFVFLRI